MKRRIVAIVGVGTLACTGVAGDLVKPDPLPYEEPPPLGKPIPGSQTSKYTRTLNPVIPGRGRAYRAQGMCFVHGDFEEPPRSWQPPPRETIPCPDELKDGKWEACPGGTVQITEDGKDCLCGMDGNPPPPARSMVCPDVES